jgi:transcriptional regulator with XRE-family HTH domain
VGLAKPKTSLDVIIGRRVRDLRKSAKVRPAEVAADMDLSISDYEQAERGLRRFRAIELFSIAQRLGVEMSDIFGAVEKSGSVRNEARVR